MPGEGRGPDGSPDAIDQVNADAFADARVEGYRRAQHRFIGSGASGKKDAGVIPAQEDDAPEGHGRHPRCEAGDVHDPGPVDVGRRHEREVAFDAPDGHRRQPTMLTSLGRTRITLRGVRPARWSTVSAHFARVR